jgi:carbonic anhydrase
LSAQDPALRISLAGHQNPFAVIVSCSDSRTTDSFIFDQELGRLFSIRAAGNCVDIVGLGSIEYAVEKLGAKVVAVMGHTNCGAVSAVVDAKGEVLHGNMYIFQSLMAGLLTIAHRDPNELESDYKARLEQENAKHQAREIFDRSKIVRDKVNQNKIWLIPALHDLRTGQVWFYKPIG